MRALVVCFYPEKDLAILRAKILATWDATWVPTWVFIIELIMTPHSSPISGEGRSKNEEKNWWQPALVVFARMSAWIVGPVFLGALIGSWVDKQYNSAPWGLMGITIIAFGVSMAGIVMEAMKEYKRIEKDNS